jgi:ornithine cyclodeaminase/alanine dehydrogenase-like protein (mu-crystallin family)
VNATVSQKPRSTTQNRLGRPGCRSAEEVTLFRSLGLGVEDVATVDLVYRKVL